MSQSKNIACMIALSISTAFASTGCVAQDTSDEAANAPEAPAAGRNGEEKTGEAHQAQCGFDNGFCPLEDFGFFPGFGWGFGGCGPCGFNSVCTVSSGLW